MTDQERLSKQVEKDNPCNDDNERGYWRKRLRDLEEGKKDENRDYN